VSTPLTEQIRAYFDDADRQQGAVDIAAVRSGLEEAVIVLEVSQADERLPSAPAHRRWPIIIVAVAAVVVIVVSALVLVARHDATEPQVPAVSPPATGDLIVSLWSHPTADPNSHNVHANLYADGRYLRATESSTGWLEQRLTPEGVELLRSEISSSGLFDQPVSDTVDQPGSVAPTRGVIRVIDGDTPIEVHCCWGPEYEQWTEFGHLLARLSDPESWLPPNAWADLETTPYVASWYEICLSYADLAEQPIEPSQVVSVLPAPARDPLDSARQRTEVTLNAERVDAPQTRKIVHCVDVDANDAHRFIAALDEPSNERLGQSFFYSFEADFVVGPIDVRVWPYLPHGEADCGCGG
jgi:hypothetical protein